MPRQPSSQRARDSGALVIVTRSNRPLMRTWGTLDVKRGLQLSDPAPSVVSVNGDLEIVGFSTTDELWSWLDENHARHRGVWVQLQKVGSSQPSVTFHDLLEAGIAFGWSESARTAFDRTSYLQKFTPRRTRGTTSRRNLAIADRLEREGRMTPAGRRALGRA